MPSCRHGSERFPCQGMHLMLIFGKNGFRILWYVASMHNQRWTLINSLKAKMIRAFYWRFNIIEEVQSSSAEGLANGRAHDQILSLKLKWNECLNHVPNNNNLKWNLMKVPLLYYISWAQPATTSYLVLWAECLQKGSCTQFHLTFTSILLLGIYLLWFWWELSSVKTFKIPIQSHRTFGCKTIINFSNFLKWYSKQWSNGWHRNPKRKLVDDLFVVISSMRKKCSI